MFVHLHNHSEYSILDGCVRLDDLVGAAVEKEMPAVALTDHGNVFGAVQFLKKAREKGVKPILGCEVYVAPRSRHEKRTGPEDETSHFHLVLLVRNAKGWRNLCELLTRSYLEGFYYRPRIDKELLAGHAEGLIGLSACLKGEPAFWLSRGMDEAARDAARAYAGLFPPGDYYIELMDHGLEEQARVNAGLVGLARELGLPLVATNDVHFRNRADAETQDVLLCIQTNKKLSDPDRMKFRTDQFYFKSAEEMAALFPDLPEAVENTGHIAARCDFDFPAKTYFLPRWTPPEGRTVGEHFEEVARAGLAKRLEAIRPRLAAAAPPGRTPKDYETRLSFEIGLIREMEFEGYFLIVWDLLNAARARGIPVGPGRGSAAGSLLAYCLEITEIDPLEYDLLFERFLNPERISLPDIDMDFCARRRQEMIEYVTAKYGQDNVCQIITFGTMAARAAIRDVGRVLEVPLAEVDKIAKMVPADASIAKALKDIPDLARLQARDPAVARLLQIASKIEGQVRHPSIHAAGIVLTPAPLVNYLPLYQSVKGEVTTQFEMKDVEAMGLLKMDLLGLRNLTVIDDALKSIRARTGTVVDVGRLPLDDPATYAVFQAGDTDGVFQFESQGMKELLRGFRPEGLRDLIAMNALYRPGPLKTGMAAEFVARKKNPKKIKFDPPELEPVLRETAGVLVYQEQVMRIAVELAGFSLAEADLLRKAMGKKDAKIMEAQRRGFVERAKAKGTPEAKATAIFDQIATFAEYGFNKSHAAVYAYLAYQTAWLKAHYPLDFLSALLTSEAERGATSQVVKYVQDCRDMGIAILPPDVNESGYAFAVEGDGIRFGLAAVKNVGETAVRGLLADRAAKGGYASPFDLFRDTDAPLMNRKALESLVKAGAFDACGWTRKRAFDSLDLFFDYAREVARARASGQTSLFGGTGVEPPAVAPAEGGEWDESTLLSGELEALGFYMTSHPLAPYASRLPRLTSHTLGEIQAGRETNGEVRVAGIVGTIKPMKTRKEERMARFVLEDMTGRIDVVAFPDAFAKYQSAIRDGQLVWLRGKVSGEGESTQITLNAMLPFEQALVSQAKKAVVRVAAAGLEAPALRELRETLERFPGDCPVYFELETAQAGRMIAQSVEVQKIAPSEEFRKSVEALLGEGAVVVEY